MQACSLVITAMVLINGRLWTAALIISSLIYQQEQQGTEAHQGKIRESQGPIVITHHLEVQAVQPKNKAPT